jgi:hypothetical protein
MRKKKSHIENQRRQVLERVHGKESGNQAEKHE